MFELLQGADWKAINFIPRLTNEQLLDVEKYIHDLMPDNRQWLRLFIKATRNLNKWQDAGVKQNKLFLSEEIKSYATFEALGRDGIPEEIKKKINIRKEKCMLEILLNSPLIWIVSIGLLVRGFVRFNSKGLMSEEQYYHDLHTVLERMYKNKKGD